MLGRMTLAPYLNFPGNTAEAMTYYQSILGGKLKLITFADFGMTEMPADGIMHAALVGEDFTIMASDAMPGAEESWGGTRVYLSLTSSDAETMRARFTALADGGTVGMPLGKQVWGDEFGLVMDRYGIEWMITIPGADSAVE